MSAITTIRPALVGKLNERQVLRVIQSRGPLSRAEVARESGLSAPTVSKAVVSLLKVGLLEEAEAAELARGAPAPKLRLATELRAEYSVSRLMSGTARLFPRVSMVCFTTTRSGGADPGDVPRTAERTGSRGAKGHGEAGCADARSGCEPAGTGRLPQGVRCPVAERARDERTRARPLISRNDWVLSVRCFRSRTRCVSRSGTTDSQKTWTTSRCSMSARVSDSAS